MRKTLLALTMLVAIAACKNNTTTPATLSTPASGNAAVASSAPSLTPEQLGELGASIHKHPTEGTKILSDRGLTQEQFERAIRQVSSDPEASKRYAAAYKRNV
ncbi:MAG: hypothetical protein JO093_03340 [Acidobacteria bacterium]|nr:hypothetical protein [Acidobacteriota bacterium]MBV9068088.1 hypothetical protein [Acidobacteriota bacterium]MBV9184623.1 hypothetical protein [Acidobacteriota bacterium]